MFAFLFLAPYARTTRYEEAFFPWKTKEKKARFARAPHYKSRGCMESFVVTRREKNTAVFYTTHNAPSAPPGPIQEESTLQ